MRVTVIGSRATSGEIGATAPQPRTPPRLVRRLQLPYWQERGWVRQGNTYAGNYQTRFGSFGGLVEDRRWSDLRFYILDPPQALRNSSHWACFQPRGKKGFHVHMSIRPADVGSGILVVERLITEAFQGKG